MAALISKFETPKIKEPEPAPMVIVPVAPEPVITSIADILHASPATPQQTADMSSRIAGLAHSDPRVHGRRCGLPCFY